MEFVLGREYSNSISRGERTLVRKRRRWDFLQGFTMGYCRDMGILGYPETRLARGQGFNYF